MSDRSDKRRIAAGLCRYCGKPRSARSKQACDACLDRNAACTKARREAGTPRRVRFPPATTPEEREAILAARAERERRDAEYRIAWRATMRGRFVDERKGE